MRCRASRRITRMWSPSARARCSTCSRRRTIPFANPEVIERTFEDRRHELHPGAQNWPRTSARWPTGRPPVGTERFVVGRDVAVTPGKVVYRNHLIELIQYAPTTETVFAEPVLIVPAWIMKYYILDLSPQNSLIRWLVGRAHGVLHLVAQSEAEDRDLGDGRLPPLGRDGGARCRHAIVPGRKRIHAAGYCLGGTLLSIAAAAMARA
jgi:polyhydroxyalkanoate synthase